MNQINALSRAITLAFSSLIAVSALSGCGSSDDRKTPIIDSEHDHDHGDDHDHDDESAVSTEMEQGRLFITAKDGSQAYIYSLAQDKVIQTLPLTGQADAVQSSPDGHYAVVMDRTNNTVNFIIVGLRLKIMAIMITHMLVIRQKCHYSSTIPVLYIFKRLVSKLDYFLMVWVPQATP
ncbi:hypothetical protein [Psychrobacter sp. WY6]|uniref:YncE family protein n=1 Tax=Psychrobacter sp. WY6 TaxID=2708350 RepID=UPI002022E72E|nr:hypothetical protein [Psychrobacter sp. WY6]